MKNPEMPDASPKNPSLDSDESKYVKRGVLFATIVMLICFNVYLDEVYNDGERSSVRSKFKRFFTKQNYDKWQQVPTDTLVQPVEVQPDSSDN